MITSKKQKSFIGYKNFLDPETGELTPMQQFVITERDFNFNKVWLQHFVNGLDEICNQKLRLAFWIIENLSDDNILLKTQRMIASESGIGEATVYRTMNALQKGNPAFLQKINSGAYRVNPDIIWKGNHKNRMGVYFEYIQHNENKQLSLMEDADETSTNT
jgi:Trp operon repressor